jgi:hypothetical protein
MKGKIKLTLLFKSGREVRITCSEYRFNYENEGLSYCGYTIKDSKPKINFNPYELEGYIEE